MKFYTLPEFAKAIGKSDGTLRAWHKRGILKPHHVTPGGHRMYSEKQLRQFLGKNTLPAPGTGGRQTVGYCRINHSNQRSELKQQTQLISAYLAAKGCQFELITSVGLSSAAPQGELKTIVQRIMRGEVERLVVLQRAVLGSLNLEWLEVICNEFETVIEVIDQTLDTDKEQFVDDVVQLLEASSLPFKTEQLRRVKQSLMNEGVS